MSFYLPDIEHRIFKLLKGEVNSVLLHEFLDIFGTIHWNVQVFLALSSQKCFRDFLVFVSLAAFDIFIFERPVGSLC